MSILLDLLAAGGAGAAGSAFIAGAATINALTAGGNITIGPTGAGSVKFNINAGQVAEMDGSGLNMDSGTVINVAGDSGGLAAAVTYAPHAAEYRVVRSRSKFASRSARTPRPPSRLRRDRSRRVTCRTGGVAQLL